MVARPAAAQHWVNMDTAAAPERAAALESTRKRLIFRT